MVLSLDLLNMFLEASVMLYRVSGCDMAWFSIAVLHRGGVELDAETENG